MSTLTCRHFSPTWMSYRERSRRPRSFLGRKGVVRTEVLHGPRSLCDVPGLATGYLVPDTSTTPAISNSAAANSRASSGVKAHPSPNGHPCGDGIVLDASMGLGL